MPFNKKKKRHKQNKTKDTEIDISKHTKLCEITKKQNE